MSKKSIVPAVLVGSILEWYEIGLYVYWASVIEQIFFDYVPSLVELINTLSVLSVGLIARPLGGMIFGRLGDRKGRKKAFMYTIILVSIPTFLIGLIPSYSQWNLIAIIFLGLMKFLQGIPAGGELPGAICYLAEESNEANRHYVCSYALIGPQIGLLLSLVECLLLQMYLPHEALMQWGWRFSFLTCGILGLVGYGLRKKLHETHEYHRLQTNHQVISHPVKHLFKRYKKEIMVAFGISVLDVTMLSLLTLPIFGVKEYMELSDGLQLTINALTLLVCSILPPFIGFYADRHKEQDFLRWSALAIFIVSLFFYWSFLSRNLVGFLLFDLLLIFLFCIQAALLPAVLARLFPISIRYTGIGFSFNICDGILWGGVPLLSYFIIQTTQQVASCVILFPIAALIFLVAYSFAKTSLQKSQI